MNHLKGDEHGGAEWVGADVGGSPRSETGNSQQEGSRFTMTDTTLNGSDSTTTPRPDPVALLAALDRLREPLARLRPDEIIATPGLDGSVATQIAMGALPRVAKQRA